MTLSNYLIAKFRINSSSMALWHIYVFVAPPTQPHSLRAFEQWVYSATGLSEQISKMPCIFILTKCEMHDLLCR